MEKKKRFRRSLVSSYVYDTIHQSIIDNIYKEGELLPSESLLCKSCNASRMTIRGALKRLSSKNIIQSEPGKGWRVLNANYVFNSENIKPILILGSISLKNHSSSFLASMLNILRSKGLTAQPSFLQTPIEELFPIDKPCPWAGVIHYSGTLLQQDIIHAAKNAHIPIIGVMRATPAQYDTISPDHNAISDLVLSTLRENGHSRIGYLSPKELELCDDSSFKTQKSNYERFTNEIGVKSNIFLCKYNYSLDTDEGDRFIQWLNPKKLLVDALYCTTPEMCTFALLHLERHGLSALKDVVISGARLNIRKSLLKTHGLKHILNANVNKEELAASTINRLIQRLQGDQSAPSHTLIPPIIIKDKGTPPPLL